MICKFGLLLCSWISNAHSCVLMVSLQRNTWVATPVILNQWTTEATFLGPWGLVQVEPVALVIHALGNVGGRGVLPSTHK